MIFDTRRVGRTTANLAFYGLMSLAFGLLVSLSGFVSYFAPIYETCQSVWDNLLVWVSSLGALVPVLVVGCAVIVVVLTLIRQWRATRRLLGALAPYWVPAPPRLVRIAREVGLEDRIDCVAGIMIGPFCYGFVRPRVCVSMALLDMLDDSELRAVLRHEGYHAQSRDPLKIWLSRALARGLYFLPLAGDLRDSYLSAKEVAADEVMARTEELPLASALVKIMSAAPSRLGSLAPAASPVEATAGALGEVAVAGLISISRVPADATEERIRRLVDGEPAQLRLPSIRNLLLSVMIVAAIFTVSYTNLSAMSVMPVSQECVTEHLLHRSDSDFQPFISSPEIGRSYRLYDAPVKVLSESACGLLTPSCPRTIGQ